MRVRGPRERGGARPGAGLIVGLAMLAGACGNTAGDEPAATTSPAAGATTAAATTVTTVAPTATATTSTTITATTMGAATTTTVPATADPVADPLTGDVAGVVVYEEISSTAFYEHTDGDIVYDVAPPVGGVHAGAWVACGFYDSEVVEEEAVHSMEHGAVWITYDATALSNDELAVLAGLAKATFPGASDVRAQYVLVSPYPGLPAPVVASAWGRQLLLDGVDDPRLGEFLRYFARGPQSPEPGAPC